MNLRKEAEKLRALASSLVEAAAVVERASLAVIGPEPDDLERAIDAALLRYLERRGAHVHEPAEDAARAGLRAAIEPLVRGRMAAESSNEERWQEFVRRTNRGEDPRAVFESILDPVVRRMVKALQRARREAS